LYRKRNGSNNDGLVKNRKPIPIDDLFHVYHFLSQKFVFFEKICTWPTSKCGTGIMSTFGTLFRVTTFGESHCAGGCRCRALRARRLALPRPRSCFALVFASLYIVPAAPARRPAHMGA
jgi:hypothetical protein